MIPPEITNRLVLRQKSQPGFRVKVKVACRMRPTHRNKENIGSRSHMSRVNNALHHRVFI